MYVLNGIFPLGRRYTSRQCSHAREAFRLRFSYSMRVTELSFRGYDVVAVSAYIAGERDSEPSVRVGFAEGMNFASAERVREGGFTRRARFQVKLNMKLRDRSDPCLERFLHRRCSGSWIESSMRPASYSIWRCAVSGTLNFISRPE